MKPHCPVLLVVLALGLPVLGEEPAPAPTGRELLRARVAEETKKNPLPAAKPTAPPANPTTPAAPQSTAITPPSTEKNPIVATTSTLPADTKTPDAKKDRGAADVLPQVEVKKRRITELDRQLAQQEREIEREKKNTKPTEVDKALNDSKIAKPLAILGGESTQFRQRVATERVNLMEDEKDLIEAIAQAKTKEQKAELQKQLDVLRMQRRELERSLR